MLKFAQPGRITAGCTALVAAVALLAGGCAPPPELSTHNAYIKRPVPGATLSVGYAEVRNNSDRRICSSGFESPVAGAIELHETSTSDGRSRMRRINELCLAPGERARLEPGGKHLMLFRLTLPDDLGTTTVDWVEADGTRHSGRFEVIGFDALR